MSHRFWLIAVVALVTAGIRFLPFLIFNGKRETPRVITYLSQVLPSAIMGMLVIYCLKGLSFGTLAGWLPVLIAGLLTVLSYIWKRNTLLSIAGGTVCYMLLVQLVFK